MLPYNLTPDEVRNWINGIVQNMQWGQGGDYYQGLGNAPYRPDEHPSFSFNAEIGAWNDKATGEKGSIKDFCQKMGIPTPWDGKGGNGGVNSQTKPNFTNYSYKDETGNIIYESVRIDTPGQGKKIFQRRPDGKGGWIKDLKGIKLIPYRLPEMIKSLSNGNKFLLISEGEKCVDLLIHNNYTAICNPMGAGKWGKMDEYFYNFIPIDTEIPILPDGDEPGQKHAEDIAKRFYDKGYRKIKIINLGYKIKKEHGDDIYDWIIRDKHLPDEFCNIINETPYYDPSSYDSPLQTTIPKIFSLAPNTESEEDLENLMFPVEAMPKALIPLILQSSKAQRHPPDLVAVPMLSVLASAIGCYVGIQQNPGWIEKPIIWNCIITDSGEGKTPAQRVAVDPIIQRQATSDDLYEKKKKEADEIWNSWNERRKNFKDVNKGKSEFIEPEPERISKRPPIFWICDTTIEALFAVLKYNPRGIIDVLDELSSLINSMNQYKGGKGNDREIWLSLWNGGAISIARKGSRAGDGLEVTTLKQTCVNVTGGIQPCKISALIGDKPGESTDGFAQRFLLSYPDCCPQFYQETGGIPEELTRNYRALVDKLFEYGETYFIDQVLTLTPEANKLWIDLFNSFMRDKIKNPDLPSVLKETWAKMPTQTLRIALVLHVTRMVSEDGVGDEVDETSMSMAILLTNYFKAHIKKVYREAMKMKGGKEESNNFRKIINTIANSQQIKLTLRDVQRNCNIQNSKIAKIILNEMIEKEILIKEESGKKEYYTFSKRYLEEGSF